MTCIVGLKQQPQRPARARSPAIKAAPQYSQQSIRPKEAAKFLGISNATLWRWVKEQSDFPKPIRLSARCTVFRVSDLGQWRDLQLRAKHSPAEKKPEQAAAAMLRKAAPDLLAALKALVAQVENSVFDHIGADHPDSAVLLARAAMAKATGSTS